MCKSARVLLIALLAVVTARELGAQNSSPEIRAQEQVVDSAMARWRRATTALRAFDDSVARMRALTDTIRAGSLRLLVEPAVHARAEVAARLAARRIDSLAGTGAGRLDTRWLIVRQAHGDAPGDTVVVAAHSLPNVTSTGKRDGEVREILPIWGVATDSMLTDWIFRDALLVLYQALDTRTHDWLFASMTPDTVTTDQWVGTRLDMLSTPATVARRCYDGDVDSCKVALRLTDVQDAITEWFDEAGRRRYVMLATRYGSSRNPDVVPCVDGNDRACVAYMRQIRGFSDPIPPHRRNTLAKTALRLGGPRAFERLLNATGSPEEKLAIAAGVPVDSVIRAWLDRVRNERRPSQDMSPGIALSSLGWILACGLLGLRSTRWR